MSPLLKAFNSTIGRKLVMGISGLGLVLFLVTHLLGNLLLYSGAEAFNAYVEKLQSFGKGLLVAEIGLAAMIIVHAVLAMRITAGNHGARGGQRYAVTKSKGDPSHSSLASRNMIWTGVIVLGFLVLHIWQFRFGPGMAEGYQALQDGKTVRDLYRLVVEVFHNPFYAAIYAGVVLFLGAHVRHGFWSAFQSLGAMTPQLSKPIYALGALLGAVFALAFLSLPVWFYFSS